MSTVKFNINGEIVEKELDELSQASEKGTEIEIKQEDLIIYKKDDFESFKNNYGTEEYKKGKISGIEMAIKDAKEKYELDFEGKNITNFADALKAKIEKDAKIEPTAKNKELLHDLELVRNNLSTLQTDFDKYKSMVAEKETRAKKDNELLSLIPANGLKIGRDITAIILKEKAGIDIDYDESGKSVITKNGEIVKNKTTLAPVDAIPFITEQLASLDLIQKANGGNGGDDDVPGLKGGYETFVKEMEANGISQGSEKFTIEMNKRIKDKTLVM